MEFLTANDWQIEPTILKERFSNAKTIPGTQKLHCFKPLPMESNPEKREVTMNFPHGPRQFFSFRDPPDIFTVDLNDPLLAVEPKLTTGQSYFITSKESVNFILHSVLYCHVVKVVDKNLKNIFSWDIHDRKSNV